MVSNLKKKTNWVGPNVGPSLCKAHLKVFHPTPLWKGDLTTSSGGDFLGGPETRDNVPYSLKKFPRGGISISRRMQQST